MPHERASSLEVEISDGTHSNSEEVREQNDARNSKPTPNTESSTMISNSGVLFGKEKPEWLPLPMAPRGTHLDLSLRPISSVLEAFEDLSRKAIDLGLHEVLQQLSGQTIKIATMCSGTETPIVALDLLRDCLQHLGHELNYEHVFSAEIVPWKQNWILRNFEPKMLFRDITEMNRSTAITAFGELAHIPPAGSVHILVAGFACVDFSMLNNKRKRLVVSLEDLPPERLLEMLGGESSVTLTAILRYARQYRPPILVLENILGASWNQIVKLFEQIDYSAGVVRLDTKYFYLPQTRQRGYLICISNKPAKGTGGMSKAAAETAVQNWAKVVRNLMRTASSPVDDFLFHNNHPDLVHSLQKVALESGTQWETDFAKDWSVCWARYQRFRESRRLGGATPYTYWTSGKVKPPEHANAVWIQKQPNRVKDTFDCLYLLSAENAKRNYDASYKSRFPDASQNVDRSLDMAKPGIVGCITPNNIIFHMGKGRPPVGLELLRLQGMNSDHLLIGRETQRQLRDLAGNAMSTTVIGSAIVAALISAFDAIDPETWGERQEVVKRSWIGDKFSIDSHSELFATHSLNFGPLETALSKIHFCRLATLSVRYCFCEGLWNQSPALISQCRECGHTACSNCSGNPVHAYTQMQNQTRYSPRVFTNTAFRFLPTRLRLRNFQHLEFLVLNVVNGMIIKEKLAILTNRFKTTLENETKERLTQERKEKRGKKAAPNQAVTTKDKKQPRSNNITIVENIEKYLLPSNTSESTEDIHPELILQSHMETNEESDDDLQQSEQLQTDVDNVLKSFAAGSLGDKVGLQNNAIANTIINISFEDEDLIMSVPERSHFWTVTYESRNLKLKLVLQNDAAEWLLYVKPPCNLAAGSKIRSILAQPVASMTPNIYQDDFPIWNGKWKAHIYDTREYVVRIQARGKLIPSWKAQLGLKRHLSDKIYDQLSIFPISNGRDSMDSTILKQISGPYQLLPRCGTAMRSLHVQTTTMETLAEPLYLFLNSMPNQASDLDEFLVANDHERPVSGENHRYIARITTVMDEKTSVSSTKATNTGEVPAALISGLSQDDRSLIWHYLTNTNKTVLSFKPDLSKLISQSVTSSRHWRPSRKPFQLAKVVIDHRLEPFCGSLESVGRTNDLCTMAIAPEVLDKSLSSTQGSNSHAFDNSNCRTNDVLLLKYFIPWHGRNPNGHTSHEPCFITELNQRNMQLNIEWLTSRLNLQSELKMWNPFIIEHRDFQCKICSPPLPAYVHRQTPVGGLLPMEDPEAVLQYLDLWKRKPRPFTISMRRHGEVHEWQDICITVNIRCLIHRLLAGLPVLIHRSYLAQEVSWRICTNVTINEQDANRLGCLRVHDCTRESPLHYAFGSSELALRGDQARVFRWMKARDTTNADPFREVVVEESVSTHLQWSIEAQCARTAIVRGGLCADHVGFGKTVVALAVIRDHINEARQEAEIRINSGHHTHIPVRATLILVPGALAFQWADEINRFWNECKWILVRSMDDLFKYSVHDIQDADVVIASTDLLQRDRDPDYTNRIAEIAGMADPAPFTSPRQYTEWIKSASNHVSSFVRDFQSEDLSHAQCIRNLQERSFNNLLATRQYLEQSKRFKGRKFIANQRARILGVKRLFKGALKPRTQSRMLGEIMGFREQRDQTLLKSKLHDYPRKRRKLTSTGNTYDADSERELSMDEDADSSIYESPISERLCNSSETCEPLALSRKRLRNGFHGAVQPNLTNSLHGTSRKELFGPVLNMFHFHRKILDEISYLNAYKESGLTAIPSNITWLLSGTARLRDPMDVKRIAAMVGVHIGPDDDSMGHYSTDSRKAVDAHRSEPEKIEASKIIHTVAWHKRRLITSQAFLDRFARTNLVELPVTSQIRVKEIVFVSRLPALHSILYHESRVLLLSQNFKDNLTFIGQGRHDRSTRLHFVLHNTTMTEEALTKAGFYISRAEGYSLMQHRCHELPDLDYAHVLKTRTDDVFRITRAVIRRVDEFIDWLGNDIDCSGLDKKDANFLLDVVKRAIWLIRTKLFRGLQDVDAFDQFHRIFSKSRLFKISYPGMTPKEARRRLDKLGRLIDSMVSSVRALRFLKNAHRLQEMAWNEDDGCFVDDVGHITYLGNARLNGLCGHLVCQRCMNEIGNSTCSVAGCGAGSGPELMIQAEDLGESCPHSTTSSSKIQTIINIVKALKQDAQALVFCQWHDINEILVHHLNRARINAKYIREGEGSTADKVAGFKSLNYGHPNWTKVLVLNPTSATAAGHNLQNVNAIIFLTPLSGSSIDDYKASYAQAIGRAARYGQKNIVAVYHLLLSRTVEINIHESRRNTKLYEKGGKLIECDTGGLPLGARELAVDGYIPQMPE